MSILPLVGGWVSAALVMTAAWLWQRRTRNAAVVDVAWTLSTGVLGIAYAMMGTGPTERRALAGLFMGSWALRLSAHLLPRMFTYEEDARYRVLREQWGDSADYRFFRFFQSQALAAPLFAAVAGIAADAPRALSWWDVAGATIAAIAISGEWLADQQLKRFRAQGANHNRVCDVGLWKYTRHPNYFFEWLFWWSFVPLAVSSRSWWLTLGPPSAMYYFLNFVTGIPPAEARALARRGAAYLDYQRRTSAFIPWWPSA
jgi:steroid 5-alpha reductase family enzyme